jgi:hypothetical protein
MNFEWNETKANSNLTKHNVSFNEATTIFGDPLAITFSDPMHSEGDDRIRIISAREMTRKERSDYEQF